MRNKEIVITVSGLAGTGKTAIAQIIYEALVDRGIQPFEFPQDVCPGRSPFELGVAVGSLQSSGLKVTLCEVHTPRERDLS